MPLGDYLHGRMQRESGKRLGEEYHKAVFLGTIFLINDLFLQIKTLQLSLYVAGWSTPQLQCGSSIYERACLK